MPISSIWRAVSTKPRSVLLMTGEGAARLGDDHIPRHGEACPVRRIAWRWRRLCRIRVKSTCCVPGPYQTPERLLTSAWLTQPWHRLSIDGTSFGRQTRIKRRFDSIRNRSLPASIQVRRFRDSPKPSTVNPILNLFGSVPGGMPTVSVARVMSVWGVESARSINGADDGNKHHKSKP